MYRRSAAARRAGFTLIEVIIVMAIIAILTSLLLVGLSSARKAGQRTQAASEINQLALSCTAFKNDFGFYPPSTFTMPTKPDTADSNYGLLRRMFPSWRPKKTDGTELISTDDLTTSTDGPLPSAGMTLDSNQCLVFFLGGPQGQGFHAAKPYAPTGTSKKGPYYDFPEGRMKDTLGTRDGKYRDPWGTPYVYFASLSTGDYSTAAVGGVTAYRSGGDPATGLGTKPVNPGGVQIISAGVNKLLGPGSTQFDAGPPPKFKIWQPGQQATATAPHFAPYAGADPGFDDMGNFNNGAQLGVNPNQ